MVELKKKRKIDWWLFSIPFLIIIDLYFYYKVQSRPGINGVLLYHFAPFLVAILSIIFIITGIIYSIIKRPFLNLFRIAGFLCLILLCFSYKLFTVYPSSFDEKPSMVNFRLPLDTLITVAWGGSDININHHVSEPPQRWAYDLMVTDHKGMTYSGDSTKLENYYCYGLPILSPAAGTIVTVVDGNADKIISLEEDYLNSFGNYVTIKVAPNEYLFICHIKQHSFKIKKGDLIEQGRLIGLVGNSGNTTEPHIHLHLQSTDDDFIGEGIPLYFHNYYADGKFITKGIPAGGIDEEKMIFSGQKVQHANLK